MENDNNDVEYAKNFFGARASTVCAERVRRNLLVLYWLLYRLAVISKIITSWNYLIEESGYFQNNNNTILTSIINEAISQTDYFFIMQR